MAQRRTIPFVGQQAKDRSIAVNNQETFNLIAAIKGQGAKQRVILESAPGLVDLGAAGTGPCRSPHMRQWKHPTDASMDMYGVFGRDVVRFTVASGAIVLTPQLDDFATKVRIARGRTHIMLVDGKFGYSYDGTTLAKISDADFPDDDSSPKGAPTHVVYQDGFFIV
ncbi:MAG: hypothetical protein MJA83_20400, partial [Gammaproteobacteria bacterium]|nr:hypothetical protein [Gammaproteobacteria bacterium]